MINSGSVEGEKVEPREGDVVKDPDGKISPLKESEMANLRALQDMYPHWVFILLHRPFQVGDEYEYYENGRWWLSETPIKDVKLANSKVSVGVNRHKDPALRDAEGWKEKVE